MRCPHCDAPTKVLDTRDDQRRRQCANGHRFATAEVFVRDMRPSRGRPPGRAVDRRLHAKTAAA